MLWKTAGSRLGNGKKSRDYLVTMVLHHNFTLRICTAYCIVRHSPPLSILQGGVTPVPSVLTSVTTVKIEVKSQA